MKSRIFLSLILAFAPSAYVFAETVQIKLTKKPHITEEGIHISTTKGDHSMYAVGVDQKVYDAFYNAKKGQCLQLEVKKGFDYSDANEIKSAKPCPAPAKPK